ncbi:inositol oxygenase isoform X1 [Scomber japonicus]|uniref:inositol oxygenase isoform X1 n=1 Tax=Scomber japonicus TaxID=13676 RepID=UPI002305D574|nr:inositol oxygenase isoform X1 [Scomber japonicus]
MRVINLGPDPSLAYRPNLDKNEAKEKEEYRNFEDGSLIDRVFNTYKLMHTNQTLDFVKQKHSEWTSCNHTQMGMMDIIMSLDQLVDESDPDVDFPNSFHAFQTAEGIRKEHPDKDWFQLVGLIHDVGKIMALWDEPQWAVVGDTFPVGCKFQKSIVFRDSTFLDNTDDKNPYYNTEHGIYEPNCGLEHVFMSWGHDGKRGHPIKTYKCVPLLNSFLTMMLYLIPAFLSSEYLYRVMKFNNCTIPEEGLYMIRFHSFYPWHSRGDYMHLCNDKDLRMLPWVQEFNKFDLYTKSPNLPNVEELKPYYQSLIDKYCPGILKW